MAHYSYVIGNFHGIYTILKSWAWSAIKMSSYTKLNYSNFLFNKSSHSCHGSDIVKIKTPMVHQYFHRSQL